MEITETGYKKPMRFGAQTIFQSDFLNEINLEHWEEFDKVSKAGSTEKGYTIADFINNAVDITAIQMVKFLKEISQFDSMEQVREKANALITEISKEVDLNTKEKNTRKLEGFLKAKEDAKLVAEAEFMNRLLDKLCEAPESQMENFIKEECIAFKNSEKYTNGELFDFIQNIFENHKHTENITPFVKTLCNLKEYYKRPE